MANGKKPGDPGFDPTRQADPGVTGDLAKMLQLLDPIQKRKGEQAAAIVRGMDKSIPRPGVPGEIRGQGLGRPDTTGLRGFYADNPHMRPGEFDPTGGIANRRRSREYARQDELGAMDFRNQLAQGLMDLHKKMQGGGGGGTGEAGQGDEDVLGGGGRGGFMEHNVFDALFPNQSRDERRVDAEERRIDERAAYQRATGIQLDDNEEPPPYWFRFEPGQSPREKRIAQMKLLEDQRKAREREAREASNPGSYTRDYEGRRELRNMLEMFGGVS